MDKISVIVPAYNCEDTIERCINSIQNQTYKNLEIIVVNDGSIDSTEEVLKSLQSEDERLRVISIPNGGVSHARNTGIDNATGDYISFVDSDDYIDKEMYETLHKIIIKFDVKIAHCSYKNVDGESVIAVGNTGKITIQDHDEAIKCLLSGRMFSGGNWNKLYAQQLFEDIRFDETIMFNEDILVNYELFDKVEKSAYLDRAFYNYVSNDNSSTHSLTSNIGSENVALVAEKMAFMSSGKSYQAEADYRYAYYSLCLYRAYVFSRNTEENEKKILTKQKIKKLRSIFRGKDRINYNLLIYFPCIYKAVYKIHSIIKGKRLDPKQ
jgi:glycosyltransferase involved in cell wall biosynthesis